MTKTDQVLQIARQKGVVRARDLKEKGLPPRYLSRLVGRGELQREGRGLYRHPEAPLTEHHSLALVAARYPDVVVCLSSALQFHELTTQLPSQVWVAREKGAWTPEASPTTLNVTHMSGASFTEGTETHDVEGIPVQIFNPAKTVVDCFKFRSKVGLSVATEALRDFVRPREGSIRELERYWDTCRVRSVMRPYVESLIR
jgi:predicted transcriptional regulator of viral defense system